MFAYRWRICAGCRKPVYGRLPPIADAYCLPCKLARACDAATDMHNKSGHYYQVWLEKGGPQGRPPTGQ